jgi:hypothetical protein
MEKERFITMLHDLQKLQEEAVLKGVHSFVINTRYCKADPDCGEETDELGIYGHIFLRFDDTEGDYLAFEFFEGEDQATWFRMFNRIKYFISCFS